MTTSNVLAKVTALIERAIRAPLSEEGRTSAVIAVQLVAEHGLLGDIVVVREAERLAVPITDAESDEIIREHQRERARKGGVARAKRLTPDERSNAATLAATARWRQWRARRRATKTA